MHVLTLCVSLCSKATWDRVIDSNASTFMFFPNTLILYSALFEVPDGDMVNLVNNLKGRCFDEDGESVKGFMEILKGFNSKILYGRSFENASFLLRPSTPLAQEVID